MKQKIVVIVQHVVSAFFRVTTNFFLNPRTSGGINLQQIADCRKEFSQGIVIVSNHINSLDPFFIFGLMPFRIRRQIFPVLILGKEELFDRWYKRIPMELMGCIPVGDGKNGKGKNVRRVIREVKRGQVVFFFPEGQVSQNGEFGSDLGAVTLFAKYTPFILVPLRINGIRPFRQDWKNILTKKKQYEVHVVRPIMISKGCEIDAVSLIKGISRYAHIPKP